MIHELKIKEKYFKDIVYGRKKFEVRKNDRNFKVGDLLALNEIRDDGSYTDNCVLLKVKYLLDDPDYCKEGFVVMGLSVPIYQETVHLRTTGRKEEKDEQASSKEKTEKAD